MNETNCPKCKTKLTTSPVDPFGRLFCPTCKYLGEVTLNPGPELGQKAKMREEALMAIEKQDWETTRLLVKKLSHKRKNELSKYLVGNESIEHLLSWVNFNLANPDHLKKCCVHLLDADDLARLPKTALELMQFRKIYFDEKKRIKEEQVRREK